MQQLSVISATAWNNGKRNPGAYGLRINTNDRENLRGIGRVILHLPNGAMADIALAPSFWNKCHELRSSAIGEYLISTGQAPWPQHQPPNFKLVPINKNTFKVV